MASSDHWTEEFRHRFPTRRRFSKTARGFFINNVLHMSVLNICLISLLGLDKLLNRSFGNGGGSDESPRVKPEAFAFFVCFGRITWSRTQRRTSTNSPSVAAGRLKPAENEKTNTWLSKPDRPQFPLETEPECLLRVMKWRNPHHARTVIRASPASARPNSTFSKTELSVE